MCGVISLHVNGVELKDSSFVEVELVLPWWTLRSSCFEAVFRRMESVGYSAAECSRIRLMVVPQTKKSVTSVVYGVSSSRLFFVG